MTTAQKPEIIKFPALEKMMRADNDTTYVINFWATWCKPCIKELPYFEQLNSNYRDKKVKVILIGLDFKRNYENTFIPFLKKNRVKSDVYLLDETDYNSWIDKVDPSWSGAIPGTLVFNKYKNYRKFFEKEFTYPELESIVKPIIN